jgi:elongation factor G
MSQGRGTFSMEISHFEETPKNIQETVIGGRVKKGE